MERNDVYYRIYKNNEGLLTIVCMQWFDEYDYDESKFFKDKNGRDLKFYDFDGETYVDGKKKATEWLNNNIKPEWIDPEYLTKKEEDYFL